MMLFTVHEICNGRKWQNCIRTTSHSMCIRIECIAGYKRRRHHRYCLPISQPQFAISYALKNPITFDQMF